MSNIPDYSDSAMHEAGHCVIAAHYGDRGDSISIIPNSNGSYGRFRSSHGNSDSRL